MTPWLVTLALAGAPTVDLAVVDLQVGQSLPEGRIRAMIDGVLESRPQARQLSEEALFVSGLPGIRRRIARCGSDDGCLAESLETLRADFALVMVVNGLAEPVFVDARLVDLRSQEVVGRDTGPVGTSEGGVEGAIAGRADLLLTQGGLAPAATLELRARPPDATARLVTGPDPIRGQWPDPWILLPGPYTVQVQAPKHEPWTESVDLSPGQRQVVDVELRRRRPLTASPWFWTALGGGVLVAAGVVAGVVASQPDCICVGESCPTCP